MERYNGIGIPCITTTHKLEIVGFNDVARNMFGRALTMTPMGEKRIVLTALVNSNVSNFLAWVTNKDKDYIELKIVCNGAVKHFVANLKSVKDIDSLGNETQTYNFCFFPLDSYHSLNKDFNLYRSVYMYSTQAIYITDHQHNIVSVNPSFINLLSRSFKEVMGKNDGMIYTADSHTKLQKLLSTLDTERDDISERLECIRMYPNGEPEIICCKVHINVIFDEETKEKQYLHILDDVTQQVSIEQSLSKAAYTDSLTGLSNRMSFNERFKDMYDSAQRLGEKLCVFYIDLDRFKYLNDEYGHDYGDLLLKHVSERLTGCFKKQDLVARVGGDEFVAVIQSDEDIECFEHIALRAINELSKPYTLHELLYTCTCSIGVSVYPDDAVDQEYLLKAADSAMYIAKQNGRNNFAFFDLNHKKTEDKHQKIIKIVEKALADKKIIPYFQPIHDVDSGELVSFEALARYCNDNNEILPPSYFMPSIEQDVLLIGLGVTMIKQVITQLRMLESHGIMIPISINLSSYQLLSEVIIKQLEMIALRFPQFVPLLKIEITETLIFENNQFVVVNIARLVECGFRLMLDDFGTGYSSIYSLKKFKFETVKIDKTFIDDIHSANIEDQTLLNTIITLVKNLKLKIICEGVETESQVSFLKDQHCGFAQGYYYSQAISKAKMLDYIKKHSKKDIFLPIKITVQ
ncbi:EAL domain-containing protein [Shewanella ulleungensis]|uniref:EAL domain-containing protein n=1 Tax=Shewanella ulleungensis TaxID=2282699 RepID=UPI003D79FBD9